jgi:hypothetical protein
LVFCLQVGEIFMFFALEHFFLCFIFYFHFKWKFAPFLTRLCYQSRVWRSPHIYIYIYITLSYLFIFINVTTQIFKNENRKKCKVEVENNWKILSLHFALLIWQWIYTCAI